MLVKQIKYTNYNGEQRTKEYCFHLNQVELIELETKYPGGMQFVINKVVEERDSNKLLQIFKEVILMSVGVRSADGEEFIKTPEIAKSFSYTQAYVELYMELLSDANKAAEFFNGIVPKSE